MCEISMNIHLKSHNLFKNSYFVDLAGSEYSDILRTV